MALYMLWAGSVWLKTFGIIQCLKLKFSLGQTELTRKFSSLLNLVTRRASAKLENLFVTAILRALEPSCQSSSANEFYHQTVVKSWKKLQLFIFPNLTIHQTSTLHNNFYFQNAWMKIQLWSYPVNMQPDKTKMLPWKTHYTVMACCLQDAEYI